MTNTAGERRKLARACKKHGLLVQPNAMKALLDEMATRQGIDGFNDLLAKLHTKLARSKPKLITHDLLLQVLEEEAEDAAAAALGVSALENEEGNHQRMMAHGDDDSDDNDDVEDEDGDINMGEEIDEDQNIDRHSTGKATTQKSEKEEVNNFFEPKSHTKAKMSKTNLPSSSSSTSLLPSSHSHTSSATTSWTMMSAFVNTPKLTFDSMRQQFTYDSNTVQDPKTGKVSPAPLMGTARDKLTMMTQRYKLIQQRTARSRQRSHKSFITTIDRLLGHSNDADHGRHVVLLGILHQSSEVHMTGCHLEMEDLTGTIPLRLSGGTEIDPTGIYLEGTTVLVHGIHDNGIFHCHSIELPPLEEPSTTRPQLPPAPTTRINTTACHTPGSEIKIWSISNVLIDDPAGVSRLETLIKRIRNDEEQEIEVGKNSSRNNIIDQNNMRSKKICHHENILILFGNFTTDPSSLSADLDELSRMLQNLPINTSVFVVPGPLDVAGAVWPLPAFSQRICPGLYQMANVHLCSNPCRLELPGGHQILLTRKDLIRESLPKQILSTPSFSSEDMDKDDHNSSSNNSNVSEIITDAAKAPLVGRILSHAFSQGHIMPQSPVYWNYDHAMHLYPLPDIMLFSMDADSDEGNTIVLHPLEEASKGESTVIVPCLDKSVVITLEAGDNDDDHSKSKGWDGHYSNMNLSMDDELDEHGTGDSMKIPLVRWNPEISFNMTVDQVDLTDPDGR